MASPSIANENPFVRDKKNLRDRLIKQIDELNDPAYKEYRVKLLDDNTIYVVVPSNAGPIGLTVSFPYDYPFNGPELIQTTNPSLVDVYPFEGTVLKQWHCEPSYRVCHYVIELHNVVNTILC